MQRLSLRSASCWKFSANSGPQTDINHLFAARHYTNKTCWADATIHVRLRYERVSAPLTENPIVAVAADASWATRRSSARGVRGYHRLQHRRTARSERQPSKLAVVRHALGATRRIQRLVPIAATAARADTSFGRWNCETQPQPVAVIHAEELRAGAKSIRTSASPENDTYDCVSCDHALNAIQRQYANWTSPQHARQIVLY